MKILIELIKTLTDLMFHNLSIAMKTCDWQANICDAPAWRYIYHTIHSCDKFYINPHEYAEPAFHQPGLDWPDNETDTVLDSDLLYDYFKQTRVKILSYLDTLNDDNLYEIPDKCQMNRLELVLSQFRHMYVHIGILNGVKIVNTNRYPRVINESDWISKNLPETLFDE